MPCDEVADDLIELLGRLEVGRVSSIGDYVKLGLGYDLRDFSQNIQAEYAISSARYHQCGNRKPHQVFLGDSQFTQTDIAERRIQRGELAEEERSIRDSIEGVGGQRHVRFVPWHGIGVGVLPA